MLKHLAMKNNIITVVHQENHGICYTRKVLIDICKADYFMFIDIDDTLCENSLAKCLKENIANYKIITMKCNYKNFNGRKKFNFYNRGIQTFLPKVSLDASKYIRRQRFGYTI
jgi:glycosyltransferase involved in cell wall biosynthesis